MTRHLARLHRDDPADQDTGHYKDKQSCQSSSAANTGRTQICNPARSSGLPRMHSLAVLHPVGPPERLPPMSAGSVRLLCSLLLAVLVLGVALHGVLDNARGWRSGLLSAGKGVLVVLGKATGASCEKKAPCHQSTMLMQYLVCMRCRMSALRRHHYHLATAAFAAAVAAAS